MEQYTKLEVNSVNFETESEELFTTYNILLCGLFRFHEIFVRLCMYMAAGYFRWLLPSFCKNRNIHMSLLWSE